MRRVLAPALLVAAVVVAFFPALGAEFLNWDDNYVLTENPSWRGLGAAQLGWMLTTLHMGHYQPLTWLSFAADHALWGMDPRGYHLTNVALHAANAVLVWALAGAIFRLGEGNARPAAVFLAALLWALHPLRVESVAWVTERRDVLSTFFLLITVLAWLRFLSGGRRAGWYGLALASFACSLLAKAWGMTLPAVLLVLDVWPLGRFGRRAPHSAPLPRLVVEKLPFAALALAAAVVAVVAQERAGAAAIATDMTLGQRGAQAAWGLVFYLRKTLVPTRLSPAYLLDPQLDPTALPFLASAVLVLALAATLVALSRRWPAVTTAFLCYVILVSPVLGFAQSGIQIAADRYTYVSTIPLALLAAAGLARILPGPALPVATLALGAVLGVLTWRQTHVWHDSLALWDHALAVDPDNWLALNTRGTRRQEVGDLDGAIADFDAAIRLRPEYAAAYNNRGYARVTRGDVAGAVADFDRALALAPGSADALLNRGTARLLQGDAVAALPDLEAAVRANPTALGWYNLASARAMRGEFRAALEDCRRALAAAPPGSDLAARAARKLAAIEAEAARHSPSTGLPAVSEP